MKKVKVGLLPLYIKLYDDYSPRYRPGQDAFVETIWSELEKRGINVVKVPICRIEPEMEQAVAAFEKEEADCIVTLNLAYSPSLEASEIIKNTKLPVLVLDTTQDYVYDIHTPGDRLMYNHGIHGVQDLCNLMIRNGKPFEIYAGHWENSDVLDRVADGARAVLAAKEFRQARVGHIGDVFRGMGDFQLTPEEFNALGITTIAFDMDSTAQRMSAVSEKELEKECEYDRAHFRFCNVDEKTLKDCNRLCLAVRHWLEEEKLTAFTVNFLDTSAEKFPYMPFTEATKGMARGIGYAGEGDMLTASLVGAFLSCWEDTSFVEMFCPDWKNGTVFMQHMGEYNFRVGKGFYCGPTGYDAAKLNVAPFQYSSAHDPLVIYDTFKPGRSLLVNLAPRGNGKFALVMVEGQMLDVPTDNAQLSEGINGWFKPDCPLQQMLEEYSRAGGTHHSAMIYGVSAETLTCFAHQMGFEPVLVGK